MNKYQVVNKDKEVVGYLIEAKDIEEAKEIGLRNRDPKEYSIVEVLME